MKGRPRYAVITPTRNDADNLRRLGESLSAQAWQPECWVIVENGSTDDTAHVVDTLLAKVPFAVAIDIGGQPENVRGGPIVRAFHAGLAALPEGLDVVVKLDADVSFAPDYFARLVGEFERDPILGIASGSAWEQEGGDWRQRHVTAGNAWGASRAYRSACLQDVLPLEERMGWDGVDALKARMNGWETRTLEDLPFRHHRVEGERDGARRRAWAARGSASRFMGYRFSYLAIRAVHHSRHDPAALAMIGGFVGASVRREARCHDLRLRHYLRDQQRLRHLPSRAREAFGRTT